ncbi:AAA family ATPase [Bdellovibrio bacteriovorus]|uniref:Putative 5-methylcytosine-specific restriction enzyme subunit McrB n=1 Tax=Bdellovibrio bacteriovorus str. Tiberius TaxID=1069642 RepID=K7YTN1_BDEBC|nr:AAA family ATPase [Bdellovibrio bacteriovorus]AFX99939.1 putative 5-methylcytosine-specific restriction enzyme subunit McrB [Bdellovibrio bacteriovorus str. Tiberius]
MAKKKKKDYQISNEAHLFGMALAFLKENNGISRSEFPGKFISYLEANKFLLPDDLKLRGDLGLSRETEKAIEVNVRNLYSSHTTLFKTGQVVEKGGAFYLAAVAAGATKKNESFSVRNSDMENVIYYGPPGTGKTYLAKRQNPGAEPTLIQFHSSYTYEHFIQGERLVSIGDHRTTQIVDGPLMICYRRATDTPVRTKVCGRIHEERKDETEIIFPTGLLSRYGINDPEDLLVSFDPGDEDGFLEPFELLGASAKFNKESLPKNLISKNGDLIEVEFKSASWVNKSPQLLIVDEINRADASRVFGELMTALADIDDDGNSQPIALQYSGEKFRWPDNLRMIGTMNSADRSIGEIDQAMKRRFKIIECPPRPDLLKTEEIRKIRRAIDEISHEVDLAKLKKNVKSDIKIDKATCDSIIDFYNKICDSFVGNPEYLIPLPSMSLMALHDVLDLHKDSIFAVERKKIGHSFHMEVSQSIAEKIVTAIHQGEISEKLMNEDFAKSLRAYYEEFVSQEIKPQVASICLENDLTIKEIIKSWSQREKESLKSYLGKSVSDKAAKV